MRVIIIQEVFTLDSKVHQILPQFGFVLLLATKIVSYD